MKIPPPCRAKATQLAANFDEVANGAPEAYATPRQCLDQVRRRNQEALGDACRQAWKAWALAWQGRARSLHSPPEQRPEPLRKYDQLRNLAADYAEAFRETAIGLRRVAAQP